MGARSGGRPKTRSRSNQGQPEVALTLPDSLMDVSKAPWPRRRPNPNGTTTYGGSSSIDQQLPIAVAAGTSSTTREYDGLKGKLTMTLRRRLQSRECSPAVAASAIDDAVFRAWFGPYPMVPRMVTSCEVPNSRHGAISAPVSYGNGLEERMRGKKRDGRR